MTYKVSSNTIPRVQAYLDEILKNPELVDFKHPDPNKLARWLHEALYLGSKLKNTKLIEIRSKYKIRVLRDRVRIELRDIPVEIAYNRAPETLTISNATTLKEVIGAIIHHKAASMDFPNSIIDEAEMNRLTTWATSEGYEVTTNPSLRVYKNG